MKVMIMSWALTQNSLMQHKDYNPNDGFPYYFNLVKDSNLLNLFAATPTFSLLESMGSKKAAFRYAPDKWSGVNLPVGPGYSSDTKGYINPTTFIKKHRQIGKD